MRLYHSPTTPFGRKVMVALLETGLMGDVTVVSATGTPLDPGSMPLDQNPLGKIPALVTDDGQPIYDSRVICRYIDDLAGGRLYPKAPFLWQTLTLEATADGILDAAILMVYESRIRPEEKRYPDWVEAQWAKITRALDSIEDRWMGHLSGPWTWVRSPWPALCPTLISGMAAAPGATAAPNWPRGRQDLPCATA